MPWRALTVTTTIQEAAGYSPGRLSLSGWNNGAAAVFISQDQTAVSTLGFPIPAGSGFTLSRQDGDEPEAALYIVAASGSQDVRIQESVGVAR